MTTDILLGMAVQYGFGLPWLLLAVAVFFFYKKLAKIEQRLNDVFTKAETKERIEMELKPTHQLMDSMHKSMDKMSEAINKLDDTMDDIRVELAKQR